MAGQIALETRYYPNDFMVVNNNVLATAVTASTTVSTYVPLFITDRPVVVDGGSFVYSTAPVTTDKTYSLVSCPNGTTPATNGSNVTTLSNVVTAVAGSQIFTKKIFTAVTSANHVAHTDAIPVVVYLRSHTAAAADAGMAGVLVQMRIRSQL